MGFKGMEESYTTQEDELYLKVDTTQFVSTPYDGKTIEVLHQVEESAEIKIPKYITDIKNKFTVVYLTDESQTLCLISKAYITMLNEKGIILLADVEGLENLIEEDDLTIQFIDSGELKQQILASYGLANGSDLAFIYKEAKHIERAEGIEAESKEIVTSFTQLNLPSRKLHQLLDQVEGTAFSLDMNDIDEENTIYATFRKKAID